MTFKHMLKQCLTEPDNETFCPIRIVSVMGVLTFFGLAVANYVQHAAFDPQAFALGLGALLTGVGAALGLKKDTPKAGD
jgi:spore maturation protein SpmB